MTHVTNDSLLEYLDQTHQRMSEVSDHLHQCPSCTKRLEALRSFTTQLRAPDAWERPDPIPPAGFVQELTALEERFEHEERLAREILPQLREAANVATIPEAWRTAGIVRTLLAIVTQERDETPATALQLARLARAVANTIPETTYPSPIVIQLRGQTWKEEANLLRHTGEYQEALDALDHAEVCFAQHPTGEYDLALVDLVRALTLSHGMGRPQAAIVLLRRATTTFQAYGDERRSNHARLATAACAFDLGRYQEARDLFHSLLPSARATEDLETAARLVTNIACCDAELDHLDAAEKGFHEAISLHSKLGMIAELVRARWGLARLLTKRQEYEVAIAYLYAIAADFTSLGLHGEAGLVLLDVVENLLVLGRSKEIPEQLGWLVEHFTHAGATTSAMTALAYLEEAMTAQRLEPRDVQVVRTWLERPHDPAAAFIPPASQ